MSDIDTTSETSVAPVTALPDYAPVPASALGAALNEQGYFVGAIYVNYAATVAITITSMCPRKAFGVAKMVNIAR